MMNRAQFKPGDFSLGQFHEFAGAFGRKGGTPDLLQKAIEDQELMGKLVAYLKSGGYEPTTSQKLARAILPAGRFFGVEEWLEHFGGRVKFTKSQLAEVAEVPWSEEDLENPGINQEHFLFLGIEKLDGSPLNLSRWHEGFPGVDYPCFDSEWYLRTEQKFTQKTCQLRWYFETVGIIANSTTERFSNQHAMLPAGYEVPTAIERVTANILYFLLNKKYLDADLVARTSDRSDDGYRIGVEGNPVRGFSVRRWRDQMISSVGVAASKKILGPKT